MVREEARACSCFAIASGSAGEKHLGGVAAPEGGPVRPGEQCRRSAGPGQCRLAAAGSAQRSRSGDAAPRYLLAPTIKILDSAVAQCLHGRKLHVHVSLSPKHLQMPAPLKAKHLLTVWSSRLLQPHLSNRHIIRICSVSGRSPRSQAHQLCSMQLSPVQSLPLLNVSNRITANKHAPPSLDLPCPAALLPRPPRPQQLDLLLFRIIQSAALDTRNAAISYLFLAAFHHNEAPWCSRSTIIKPPHVLLPTGHAPSAPLAAKARRLCENECDRKWLLQPDLIWRQGAGRGCQAL